MAAPDHVLRIGHQLRDDRAMIRDLKGTIEREGAEIGLFITLAEPTPLEQIIWLDHARP